MRRYTIEIAATTYVIDVQELAADRFRVSVGGETFEVHLATDADLPEAAITPAIMPSQLPTSTPWISTAAAQQPAVPTPRSRPSVDGHLAELSAPLPGTIISVAVVPGDYVDQGQELLVLEAMKMKNTIRASRAGVVAEILVRAGQTVLHGDVLLRFAQE